MTHHTCTTRAARSGSTRAPTAAIARDASREPSNPTRTTPAPPSVLIGDEYAANRTSSGSVCGGRAPRRERGRLAHGVTTTEEETDG